MAMRWKVSQIWMKKCRRGKGGYNWLETRELGIGQSR